MNSLYGKEGVSARLLRMLESRLPGCSKPTRRNLACLVLGMLVTGEMHSVRNTYRRFLKDISGKSLNAFYYACSYAVIDKTKSWAAKAAEEAVKLIPPKLKDYPVMISIDDTLVEKFGKHFEHVGTLFDHADHQGRPYKNGHCFVASLMSVPVALDENGEAICEHLPLEARMWSSDGCSKLETAACMVRETAAVMPKGTRIVVLCDSWYTKKPFIGLADEIPELDIIGAVRSDTALYEPAPPKTGRRGRPRKRGNKLDLSSFQLKSGIVDNYKTGSRTGVLTNLFGSDRPVTAVVTEPETGGARRLYLSTIPEAELAELMHVDPNCANGLILRVYHKRWSIEVTFEMLKFYWSMNDYMLRSKVGIERLMNLIFSAYSAARMLPHLDDRFASMRGASVQDIRFEIGARVREEQFSERLLRAAANNKKMAPLRESLHEAILTCMEYAENL